MTVSIPQINAVSDSFGQWLSKTNQVLLAANGVMVSTNSNTATGNAAITGTFSANVFNSNTLIYIGNGSANVVANSSIFLLQASATGNVIISKTGMLIDGATKYSTDLMLMGNSFIKSANVNSDEGYFRNKVYVGSNTIIGNNYIQTYLSNTEYTVVNERAVFGDVEANVQIDRDGISIYANPSGTQVVNSYLTATTWFTDTLYANNLWTNLARIGRFESIGTGNTVFVPNVEFIGNTWFHGANNYFDFGITSNGSITITPTGGANAYLTLSSDNYAGVRILGDRIDTAGEPGGAFVTLYVDDAQGSNFANASGFIGVTQSAGDDIDGNGTTITNSKVNAFVVGSGLNRDSQIVANNNVGVTLAANLNLGIGTTDPSVKLDINPGVIKLRGSSSGFVTIQAPANPTNITFSLPPSDGSSSQYLGTNGSGGLGWYTPPQIDNTTNLTINSLGVGTPASGTAGEIRATKNITAYYSDRRLKENINVIADSLSKVLSLRGVTYNSNDVAEQYGYDDRSQQVGVIAQELQAVLPEAVRLAPFDTEFIDGKEVSKSGENYLTVQYEKIVPLLIEAIKELKAEIDELKGKVCDNCTCSKG